MRILTTRDLANQIDPNSTQTRKVYLLTPYGHPIPLRSINITDEGVILAGNEETEDEPDDNTALWNRLNAKLRGPDPMPPPQPTKVVDILSRFRRKR